LFAPIRFEKELDDDVWLADIADQATRSFNDDCWDFVEDPGERELELSRERGEMVFSSS
jgi:hypothetical protein